VRAAVLILVAVVLALPGAGHAVGEPRLVGIVSDPSTIELRDANGNPVTSFAPGTYDFEIRDEAASHNFHLAGPGVNRATGVSSVETVIWEDVVLQPNATYLYVCDPHAAFMSGSFTTAASAPPPGPPPPGPPPPGPPTPPPPPPPPPPPRPSPPPPPAPSPQPPAHVHRFAASAVRIWVSARGGRSRVLVAQARVNQPAVARLVLLRAGPVHASARKQWRAGLNTIRVALPRSLPRGRWTAELRVRSLRFKRTVRIG
jgi:hypothetical protein